jgi:hypothetical protein
MTATVRRARRQAELASTVFGLASMENSCSVTATGVPGLSASDALGPTVTPAPPHEASSAAMANRITGTTGRFDIDSLLE